MENCVQIGFDNLLEVRIIEYVEAKKPFIHQNRCVDFNVFIFIVSGEMRILENGKEYIVKPGEIFFLKSGVHHWGEHEIPRGTRWYYIHFYTTIDYTKNQLFNDYGTYIHNQEFTQKDYNYYIPMPKIFKVDYPAMLEKRLSSLCKLFNSDNILRLVNISLSLSEIFFEIYINHKKKIRLDKADIITQRLIDYLQKRLKEDVSSSEISEYINLNYNYITQIFKAKTGMSISSYRTRMKITEASRLLRETNLNVSEIGLELGYQDPLYFSHIFKRITGISPTEYKKQAYSLTR